MDKKDDVGAIFENATDRDGNVYTDKDGNPKPRLSGKIKCPACASVTNVNAYDNRQTGSGKPVPGSTGKNQPVIRLKRWTNTAPTTGVKNEDDIPF